MADIVTVALDAMGGDHGVGELTAGAAAAARPGELEIVLVGDERSLLAALGGDLPPGLSIRHAADVIAADEEPAAAVRSRPESSIVIAAQAVADGDAQAAVSAGSTGAMLAASLLRMRRLPGVIRPCIAAVLPGAHGPVTLVDAGATADCRPEQLVQFAHMGTTLAEDVLDVRAPTCGLLTIGEEPGKGNLLAREAFDLLTAADGLRFRGNVEGRDLFGGAVDVIVTDGFTGNVALKTAEGTARYVLASVREAAMTSLRSRLGGLLVAPAVRGVRKRMDPETYGGAYLLGLQGVSVIAHGSSSRVAIANACRYAAAGVRHDVAAHVAARIGRPQRTR
jgi:glycerol-3-phosphate acyltransferase PlsX